MCRRNCTGDFLPATASRQTRVNACDTRVSGRDAAHKADTGPGRDACRQLRRMFEHPPVPPELELAVFGLARKDTLASICDIS